MNKTIFHWGSSALRTNLPAHLLAGITLFPTAASAAPISLTNTRIALLWPASFGTALLLISALALGLWLRQRRDTAAAERRAVALREENTGIHRQLQSCKNALSDHKRQLTKAVQTLERQRQETADLLAIIRHHLRQPLDALQHTLGQLARIEDAESSWLVKRAQRQLQTANRALEEIRNWGQVEAVELQLPPDRRAAEKRGLSILLVENDRNPTLCDKLQALGHRVERQNNGVDGASAALEKPFDLVLMDSHLPLMDGVEATQKIRRGRVTQLPVFALLNDPRPGDKARYQARGLTGVLARPVSDQELEQLLKWASRHARGDSRQTPPPLLSPMLETGTLKRQQNALGQRRFAELLSARAAALPKQTAALTSALTGRHWLEAKKQAQTLAVQAEEVGLEAVAARLRELAAQLGIDKEREACRQQRTELLNLMRASVQALKSWREQNMRAEWLSV
ncbi:response regulator [Microbulbifer thermotolerans]|uniref:response regulator n=1 Tax=Microbulbifer thermotolerans TaxID=252514 RepID=UPI00224AC244|nr:response regulator [Microbulbifer thermotolerans]MCX2840515.1 response regulator [Microbulbifer thermotolerans]